MILQSAFVSKPPKGPFLEVLLAPMVFKYFTALCEAFRCPLDRRWAA